nr:unnamed protein product [Digitaria exilis]
MMLMLKMNFVHPRNLPHFGKAEAQLRCRRGQNRGGAKERGILAARKIRGQLGGWEAKEALTGHCWCLGGGDEPGRGRKPGRGEDVEAEAPRLTNGRRAADEGMERPSGEK